MEGKNVYKNKYKNINGELRIITHLLHIFPCYITCILKFVKIFMKNILYTFCIHIYLYTYTVTHEDVYNKM